MASVTAWAALNPVNRGALQLIAIPLLPIGWRKISRYVRLQETETLRMNHRMPGIFSRRD